MTTEIVYVYLPDEDVDCWRPVDAVHEGGNRYRITSVNPDPDGERWEFETGQRVVCERRTLSRGGALVVTGRVAET